MLISLLMPIFIDYFMTLEAVICCVWQECRCWTGRFGQWGEAEEMAGIWVIGREMERKNRGSWRQGREGGVLDNQQAGETPKGR